MLWRHSAAPLLANRVNLRFHVRLGRYIVSAGRLCGGVKLCASLSEGASFAGCVMWPTCQKLP